MTAQLRAGTFLGLSPGLTLAAGIAAGVLLLAGWLIVRARSTPAERERKRRLLVHSQGRICDGNVLDFRNGWLHYSYAIAGIEYAASQDVSSLREILPPDPATVIGPGSVKYLVRNPANSIVVCEHWSGLRARSRTPGLA